MHTAQGPRVLDITFEWEQGRLLAVYGPSGAGKTTLLRILAGLTDVATGSIEVHGDTWLDSAHRVNLPTRHRSIGFVFQDFALFPHLTVRQQLEFALPKKSDKARVDELLSLMELEELQHQRPALLSGGQQQRIAIARAIARRPRLLLLDEPLSALDEEMRLKLQGYILKVHRHYGLTTILVSHYLPEILRLSDEVLVLEEGLIARKGACADLFPMPSAKNEVTTFQAPGEIIEIIAANPLFFVNVLCAGTLIKIAVNEAQIPDLQLGQRVYVSAENFHPFIVDAEKH
jgi:molybdate transport system ATP-binding protein